MADDRRDPIPFEEPRRTDGGRDQQKGAQQHAQGMHGPKSRAHLIDQLESGRQEEGDARNASDRNASDRTSHDEAGKHRLFEGREQRDEAELNSEKNRLEKDIKDHGHDMPHRGRKS